MQRKFVAGSFASPGYNLPSNIRTGEESNDQDAFASRPLPLGRAVSPPAHERLLVSSAGAAAGLRLRPRPVPAPSGQAPSWLPPGASLSKGSAAHRAHRAASAPYQRNQRRSTAPPSDKSPQPGGAINAAQYSHRWPTPSPTGNHLTGSPVAWADYPQAAEHALAASTSPLAAQGSPVFLPHERPSINTHWSDQSMHGAVSFQPQLAAKYEVQHAYQGASEKPQPRPALGVITNTSHGPRFDQAYIAQRQPGAGGWEGKHPTTGGKQAAQPKPSSGPDDSGSTHQERRPRQQPGIPVNSFDAGQSRRLAPWLLTDFYDAGASSLASPSAAWQAAPAAAPPAASRQTPQSPPMLDAAGQKMSSTWSTNGLPSPVGVLLASLGLDMGTAAIQGCAAIHQQQPLSPGGLRARPDATGEVVGRPAGASREHGAPVAAASGHSEPAMLHYNANRSVAVPMETFPYAPHASSPAAAAAGAAAVDTRRGAQQQQRLDVQAGALVLAATQADSDTGGASFPIRSRTPSLAQPSSPLCTDPGGMATAADLSSMQARGAPALGPGLGPGSTATASSPQLAWLRSAMFPDSLEGLILQFDGAAASLSAGNHTSAHRHAAPASAPQPFSQHSPPPQLMMAAQPPVHAGFHGPPVAVLSAGATATSPQGPAVSQQPRVQPQPARDPERRQPGHGHQQDLYSILTGISRFPLNAHDVSPELLSRKSPEGWVQPAAGMARSADTPSPGPVSAATDSNAAAWAALLAGEELGPSPRLWSSPSFPGALAPAAALDAAAGAPVAGAPEPLRWPSGSPPIPAEWLEGVEEMLPPRPAVGNSAHFLDPGPRKAAAGIPAPAAESLGAERRHAGPHALSSPPLASPQHVTPQQVWAALQRHNQQHNQSRNQQQLQPGLQLALHHQDDAPPGWSPPPSTHPTKQQQLLHGRSQQPQPQVRAESRGRVQSRGRSETGAVDPSSSRAVSTGRPQRPLNLPLSQPRGQGRAISPPPGMLPSRILMQDPSRDHRDEQLHRRPQHKRQKQQQQLGQGWQPKAGRQPGDPPMGVRYSSFDAVASAIAGELLIEAENIELGPSRPSVGTGAAAGGGHESSASVADNVSTAIDSRSLRAATAAGGADAPAGSTTRGKPSAGTAPKGSSTPWSAAAGQPPTRSDTPEASPGVQAVEEFLDRVRGARGPPGDLPPGLLHEKHTGTAELAATPSQLWSVAWGADTPAQDGAPRNHHERLHVQQQPQPRQPSQHQRQFPVLHFPMPAASLRVVQRVFAGWRRKVVLRRVCACLAYQRAQRQGAEVLRAWRTVTRAQQARHQASFATLAALRTQRLLRSAWLAWRGVDAASRHAARAAAARRSRSLQARALRGWVTVWARAASVRVLLRHRATAMSRACLAAWREVATAAAAARRQREHDAEQADREEDEQVRTYGLAVHRVLRLRSCFRRWLFLTDVAVHMMTQQQALRHAMHQELLHEAALRTAADEVARHRYLAPALHAWRALVASTSVSAAGAPSIAAPGSSPREQADVTAASGHLQLQVLVPMASAAPASRRGPPVAPILPKPLSPPSLQQQQQQTGVEGLMPWVMAGTLVSDSASLRQPPNVWDPSQPLVGGDGDGDGGRDGDGNAVAADERRSVRDSSSGSAGSFDFRWTPPHRQQHLHSARGTLSRSVDMTPRVDRSPGQGAAAGSPPPRRGSTGSGASPTDSPPGGRAPAPSPADEELPHDLRRAFSTGSASHGAGSDAVPRVRTVAAASAPAVGPLVTPDGTGARAWGTVPVLIQQLSAGAVGPSPAGGAPLSTPPSVQATRLVQSRTSRQDGPGGPGGRDDELAGGRAVLADLAPDVLLQLLESDLEWYTEQYLTPPRPEGARTRPSVDGRSGGAATSHTAVAYSTRTSEDPGMVTAAAPAGETPETVHLRAAQAAKSPPAPAVQPGSAAAAVGPGLAMSHQDASPLTPTPATTCTQPGTTATPDDDGWMPPARFDYPGTRPEWQVAAAAPDYRNDNTLPGAAPWEMGGPPHAGPQPIRQKLLRSVSDVARLSSTDARELDVRGWQQPPPQPGPVPPGVYQQPPQPRSQATAPLGDVFLVSQGPAALRADSKFGRPARQSGERRRSTSSGSAAGAAAARGAAQLGLGGQWPPMGQYAASPTASDDDLPYKRYVALPGDSGLLRLRGDRWQPTE